MTSLTDLPQQPDTLHQSLLSFKQLKLLTLSAAILLITLVAVTGGYLLGSRNNRFNPPSLPSPSPQLGLITQILPTTPKPLLSNPSLNPSQTMVYMNWKTYINDEFGISFNYPNDWMVMLDRVDSKVERETIARGGMGPINKSSAIYSYLFAGNVDIETYIKNIYGIEQNKFLSLSKMIINNSPYEVTEYTIKYINLPTDSPPQLYSTRINFIGIEKSANMEKFLFANFSAQDQIFYNIASSFKFTQ